MRAAMPTALGFGAAQRVLPWFQMPSRGNCLVRPGHAFNGVKVFAATMFEQRGQLGEKVTEWIAAHPSATITEFVVTQSSDAEFHCLAISLFYEEQMGRY
jgi:hypothetical protein